MKIARGRVVRMHYTLRDERGNTIERSAKTDPLVYLHGYGHLVPGLEKALDGEEPGLRTTITVGPAEGYGERQAEAVIRAPLSEFPEGMDLAPGVEVQAETPDGPLTFVVVEVDGDHAVLDANHPLAGQTLTFDVEVLDVREADAVEIAHGHVHGPGAAHHR